jgi:arylsulfatase A-like enzyme
LIVASDHGEAFGEHGAKTHGTTLYDEVLRVPLLFWRPGIEPAVVHEMVTLIDLGPTILDAFSLPTSPHIMGQSLLPFISGKSPELTRPILAETRLIQAFVNQDRMKLIFDTRSGRKELYDLKKDPEEKTDLAGDEQLMSQVWPPLQTFFRAHTIKREGYTPPFIR